MKAMTWDEAVKKWLASKPRQASDAGDYFRLQSVKPFLSGKRLAEIDSDLIDEMIIDLSRRLKPSTVNRTLVPVRIVLRKAYRQWKAIGSPVHVRTLPTPKGRIRRLSPEEVDRLLKELPTHQRDMAEFALATGFRASNVCRLEWGWVDMDRKVCSIPADKVKNRQTLTVPLNQMAMDVLTRRQGIHKIYVFTYRGDIVRKWCNRTWRESVKRAGLGKDVTPHVLRHTWASGHAMAGTRLPELKELGGWRDHRSMSAYIHLSVDHLRGAVENCSLYYAHGDKCVQYDQSTRDGSLNAEAKKS